MPRVISVLGAAALAALALAGSAQADDAVVPILTGGEVHWTGTASRSYNVSSTDPSGTQTQDSGHSNISWDTRMLLSGYYPDAPKFARPEGGVVFATSSTKDLGTSYTHHYELDCDYSNGCDPQPQTQDCSWTESNGGAAAGALDGNIDRDYEVVPFSQSIVAKNYTCQKYSSDDPSFWGDCAGRGFGYAANVCLIEVKFPAKPLEGDQASITRTYNHATNIRCSSNTGDWPCKQTGHSTVTLSCALCVTGIQFEQPDLPGRSLVNVGSDGTFDGNRVRVTATIHNATDKAITAPVRFRDLTVDRDLTPAAGGEKPADEISFPAKSDTKVVLDWDTEGFAWYLPHKAEPHKIGVLTPYGGARRDLSVRPKPVLLVHGFNADASTWNGYPDFFTNVRKDWMARAVTGMNTNPWYGNTLAGNARVLGHSIEQLRDEYNAEHVDLVVHSMGGLISRQYLDADAPSDPDHRPVVAHLVMLGTPNEGSTCAYLAANLSALGPPTLQLTPAYLLYFNRVVTNTRGTKLSVLAGIAPRWEQAATTALCGLLEPNDLVVWKTSAFWTLTDTATQIGLVHTQMTHDADAFRDFVEPHLAVTPEGRAVGVARDSSIRVGGAAASAGPSPTGDIPGLALATKVQVSAGRSARVPLHLTGGSALNVMTLAPPGVRVQLTNAAGKVVSATTSSGEMSPLTASGKLHGTWTIVATNPSHSGVPVSLAARVTGDSFKVVPKLEAKGGKLLLSVTVSGAGRHARASGVEIGIGTSGDQSGRQKVRFRQSHGGFSATLKPMPGGTIVTVTVQGSNGRRSAVAAS